MNCVYFTLPSFSILLILAATNCAASTCNMFDPSAGCRALVVATRLHLGKASAPPLQKDLDAKVASFIRFCSHSCQAAVGVVAVDATERIAGFDLVKAVQRSCDKALEDTSVSTEIILLPVSPWGNFVPALNALVTFATTHVCKAKQVLFVSAETMASPESIDVLLSHITASDDVLVAGALLPGHLYEASVDGNEALEVELNGRTAPWNTMAMWNLKKLALTGFQLVSEGHLTDDQTQPSYGVEEVVAIAMLQALLGKEMAVAKLVRLPGVDWDQSFCDPERQKWHVAKMESKRIRSQVQLDLLGLKGSVIHC
jgi:hypothetical protein